MIALKSNKISVIIPTFNRVAYIGRAINSVINQTHRVKDIIVIDNNSSDNTQEYIKENFPKVKVFAEASRGVSNARNLGIKISKSDWVAFLDSDDEWLPKKIEEQIKLSYQNTNYKLIHTNEIWYKDGKKINQKNKHKKKGGHIFNDSLDMCKISPSSVLCNKKLFQEYGLFNSRFIVCEDYELWLRICSKEEIGFVDKSLIKKYGGHKDQLSFRYWGMDRYRILAMENLLYRQKLSLTQKKAVVKKIIEKANIILKGAVNRNNIKVINKYRYKLKIWNKYYEGIEK